MMLAFSVRASFFLFQTKIIAAKDLAHYDWGEKKQLLGRLYRGDEVENIVQRWMSVISTQEVTSQSAVCPTQPMKRHFFSTSDL